jgi:hypothetical protein
LDAFAISLSCLFRLFNDCGTINWRGATKAGISQNGAASNRDTLSENRPALASGILDSLSQTIASNKALRRQLIEQTFFASYKLERVVRELAGVCPEKPSEAHCGAHFPTPATISDNTNSNVATNGQSLHTHRRWFAAKNPAWRSRTRSWTPHGTPPREAAARRVMHKKMQIRAALSRRAKALTQWHWACGICSSRACALVRRTTSLKTKCGGARFDPLVHHACSADDHSV